MNEHVPHILNTTALHSGNLWKPHIYFSISNGFSCMFFLNCISSYLDFPNHISGFFFFLISFNCATTLILTPLLLVALCPLIPQQEVKNVFQFGMQIKHVLLPNTFCKSFPVHRVHCIENTVGTQSGPSSIGSRERFCPGYCIASWWQYSPDQKNKPLNLKRTWMSNVPLL